MKTFLTLCFILFANYTHAQLSFPKGFHLIAGDNLAGDDDVYTNGRYSFDTHKIFRDYDFKGNDEGIRKYMSAFFGFPFYLTRDGLCWGTGQVDGFYAYIISTWDAEVIELYSKTNDNDFSFYSKWLLTTVRQYRKEGKSVIFPMRVK